MNWTGIPVSYTLAWVADFWKMVSEYDYLQSGSLRARVKKYLLNLSIKKIRVISKNRIKSTLPLFLTFAIDFDL